MRAVEDKQVLFVLHRPPKLLKLLLCLTLLVSNSAGSLASRLAGGLALAATALSSCFL